jgi:hypothetical protein
VELAADKIYGIPELDLLILAGKLPTQNVVSNQSYRHMDRLYS